MTNSKNDSFNELINLLGLSKNMLWMMTPNERFTLLGLINILKPESILELGYADGGCTTFLSRLTKTLYTVDKDDKVLSSSSYLKNVIPLNMATNEAFEYFNKNKLHFDLCIIDADHSTKGAFNDLKSAIKICDVIIMHDTSNPSCRKGYGLALKGKNFYYDLDLIEGHNQTDGLWGGLGIVIPSQKETDIYLTKRYSHYPLLKIRYICSYPQLIVKEFVRIFNYYVDRLKKRLTKTRF